MRRIFSRRAMALVLVTMFLAMVTSSVSAQPGGGNRGGKDKDGDDGGGTTDPPPAAPVQYRVVWKSHAVDGRPVNSVQGMNDKGEVVGTIADTPYNFRAFLWDATGLKGIDILAGNAIPEGWLAYSAQDINSSSRVVGEAINPDLNISCPFIYDANLNPKFQLIPKSSVDGYAINDSGDVVFWDRDPGTGESYGYVYDYDTSDPSYENPTRIVQIPLLGIQTADINSSGQVIGTLIEPGNNSGLGAFRYTPGASPQIETWLTTETGIEEATSINDVGWFAGYIDSETFRFDSGFTPLGRDGWNSVFRIQEINNRGDVLVGLLDNNSYFFSDDPDKPESARGKFLINDLVDPNDAKWLGGGSVNVFLREFSDLNNPNEFTDPDNTGFGEVCGAVEFVEETGKGKDRSTVYRTEAFKLVPTIVTQ